MNTTDDAPPRSITCPICGRTSWHPTDVAEGYCGNCHGWTGHPDPELREIWQVIARAGLAKHALEQHFGSEED
ncbi:MAG: hypothetical protein J2P43_01180 [Candidatus Dormibacteraeota bacterium]|nr:hypothetical protein [Candidatus Dormibacteraeota bacterium]